MTTVNSKIYVARVLGGASSQEVLDMAGEALLRAYSDWQAQKNWRFLLKNTSLTTAVTGVTATAASAVVSPPSTAAFDFVNVGQTVAITSSTATLAASATVSSFARGSDGVITSITLSASFGGTTDAAATLTFGADIPVIAGTNDYNLPIDHSRPATARFTSNTKRLLIWREQAYWDRVIIDQTVQGLPAEFTTFNPYSELTQNFGENHMKFDRIPSANDVCRLLYYRRFNTTGTYVDIPDEYLYKFLDYARAILLEAKRAQDDPQGFHSSTLDSFQQAQQTDESRADGTDADECIKSQYEMGMYNRPLWTNGDFDSTRWIVLFALLPLGLHIIKGVWGGI
jgi:hypothetical protein